MWGRDDDANDEETTMNTNRTLYLNRIKAEIRRTGLLGFTQARMAMFNGRPSAEARRDAKFHNMTIREFIAAGELVLSWTEYGDSLIGLPG
jgi:hypothetical protein